MKTESIQKNVFKYMKIIDYWGSKIQELQKICKHDCGIRDNVCVICLLNFKTEKENGAQSS